jgi:hypothetical protein
VFLAGLLLVKEYVTYGEWRRAFNRDNIQIRVTKGSHHNVSKKVGERISFSASLNVFAFSCCDIIFSFCSFLYASCFSSLILSPDTFHPITEEASSGSDNSGPQETRKQQKTALQQQKTDAEGDKEGVNRLFLSQLLSLTECFRLFLL